MAQRFAIDGNFTQSFVGGVSLNAQACPSNNPDEFASLFYDLDTGTVCYITASTDFCYEFFFNNEATTVIGRGIPVVRQALPPVQSFQFVGNGDPVEVGNPSNLSAPKGSLTETKFLMFDSSSANAGDLLNYLIQRPESGSIKLSTPTNAVQINYTAQAITGSTGNNKVILGNTNNNPEFASSSFTVFTQTSDTPFTNGERVCVEILGSGGGGGSSTTYQTGSSVIQTQLTNLLIKDFDSNVFVTSDPVTGQLTLQFGTPSEPTSLAGSLIGFNTNRFNKETDIYNGRLTYNLNGTTFESASLIDVTGGGQIVKTSTDGDGDISFGSFSGTDPQATGSRTFKASLRVTLTDGTEQSFETSNFSGTIVKSPPGNPSITSVVSSDIQGGFNQSNGGSNTTFKVHIGATGSILRTSGSGAENGYEYNGGDFTALSNAGGGNTGILSLNYGGGIFQPSATIRNFFVSPSGENDPLDEVTTSRIVSSDRMFTWKFGAAATASLLEGDVLDLTYLQNLGFQSSSTQFDEDPQGESFTIQGNSFDHHYLIVKDNVATSTPTITVNNQQVTFPQVAHYSSIEGGKGYRVFRTGQQGSAAVTYTYTAD